MVNKLRTSFAWSFASRYLVISLNFISVVVLARLLTPEEIGVFSIAVALMAIGQVIRDFGISDYIILEKDLTKSKLASAFTISLSICYSLVAIFYLLKGPIASYYGRPEIEDVISLLLINFLLIPFGTLTLSVLKREMQFQKLMFVEVSSTIVNCTVSISLAYLGFSYMSLGWAAIAGTITTIAMLLLFRPAIIPALPGFRSIPAVMSFGWKMSWSYVANHLTRAAPEIIVGKAIDAHSVAILGKGLTTTTMFTDLVYKGMLQVIQPYFAQIKHENGDLKSAFFYSTIALTVVAWPFFSFFILMSEEVVLFLFGNQWVESASLLQLASLAAMIFFSITFTEKVLVTQGKAGKVAQLHTFYLIITIILLIITAQISLYAVAAAFVAEKAIRAIILYRELGKCMSVTLADFKPMFVQSGGVTLLCIATIVAIQFSGITATWNEFWSLLLTGTCFVAAWLGGLYLFRHPLHTEVTNIVLTVKQRILKQAAS